MAPGDATGKPMSREERWAALGQAPVFDLAVIGGGATGLGVALDAALRGYSVVLFESHDFASGTSSRSTKLLHGGVRYLAQGNLALVREALAERATVLRNAPHLAQPLPFVMPAYHWWQKPFYGLGLMLYDQLAGPAGIGRTAFLSPAETLAALPGIRPQGLKGGVRYWDGQFDDARLALTLALSAERAGAVVLNHAKVMSVRSLTAVPQPLSTLRVQDQLADRTLQVQARCVVNATGVWVDELRSHSQPPNAAPARLVSPSQGVHIVVDREFMPGNHALLVPRTRDGRVLFAVPWLGKLVLGTTDTPRQDVPREPRAFDEELEFILRESGHVLSRPVRREDVRSIWVGLRPLVAQPSGTTGGTQRLSREHTIVIDPSGLVTVTGGKWTTYRAMADDVLARCTAAGLLAPRPGGTTEHHRLEGCPGAAASSLPLYEAPGPHLFGRLISASCSSAGAEVPIGMGLTEAMVRHMVRREHACSVEDVLARRWRALFLDARQAAAMAPRVAAILQEEGGGQPDLDVFLALCQRYLP